MYINGAVPAFTKILCVYAWETVALIGVSIALTLFVNVVSVNLSALNVPSGAVAAFAVIVEFIFCQAALLNDSEYVAKFVRWGSKFKRGQELPR
jgi:hypothetical protein